MSLNIDAAVSRLCASSYSAKPKVQGLPSASETLIHLRRPPAHLSIDSMPSSPPTPSVMFPTKIVRAISSRVGGCSAIACSLICCRSRPPRSSPPIPSPLRGPPADIGSSLRPPPIASGAFTGPPVPRRITGALKSKLAGMPAGGWKFALSGAGRPGAPAAGPGGMPGGAPTPGAAIPGGGPMYYCQSGVNL